VAGCVGTKDRAMEDTGLKSESAVGGSSGDSGCELAAVLGESYEELTRQGSAFHRSRLPLLLVAAEHRVISINQAARREGVVLQTGFGAMRLGDALLCENAASTPWGCGVCETCRSCPLRQMVGRVATSELKVIASEVAVTHSPLAPERVTRHLVSTARLRASSAPQVLVVLARLDGEG